MIQEVIIVATATGIVAGAARKVVQFVRELVEFYKSFGKKPSEAK